MVVDVLIGLFSGIISSLTGFSDSFIELFLDGYIIINGNKTKEFWDGRIRSENKPLHLKIRNICSDETVWKAL